MFRYRALWLNNLLELHTQSAIAKIINFDLDKIELEPRIVEYDLGVFSGLAKTKFDSVRLRDEISVEIPENFKSRINSFLLEISKQDHSEVLIVAHSGVQRMIEIIRTN